MKVKDIMHSGVICLDENTPLREVARKMREADVGAIPIRKGGRIVGIVTDRDITCRAVADGSAVDEFKARDVMTAQPACCSCDDDIAEAVEVMEQHQVRRLPVLSDHELVGMLSLGDISFRASEHVSAELLRAVSGRY